MNTWILVADAAHARIFNSETATAEISEIESDIHPQSQQREQDLTSDLPGRQAGGATGSHHSVSSKASPKEHEASEFAKVLCRHLEVEHNAQKFRQLIVVAAPAFLGLLRAEMSKNVSRVVTLEIDKDIVEQDVSSIRGQLPEVLPHLAQ